MISRVFYLLLILGIATAGLFMLQAAGVTGGLYFVGLSIFLSAAMLAHVLEKLADAFMCLASIGDEIEEDSPTTH